MKRWILSIGLAGLLGAVGCSGGGGDGGGDDPGPDPDIECLSTVDCDGDGLIDTCDSSPYDSTVVTPVSDCDSDGDGYYDGACAPYDTDDSGTMSAEEYVAAGTLCDNCIGTSNDQTDSDGDFFGDVCDCLPTDTDADGDCVADSSDNCACPSGTADCSDYSNYDQADTDKDGTGDACDSSDDRDDDGDGYTVGAGDCNDSDASVNPGSTTVETFGGTDYNCDGATGSLSAALFVDLALCASLDGEDGSFNKPYNLLQEALDNLGDKTSIYVYKNDACSTENITVSKAVTIVGGVYCVDGDGDEIDMATDSDDCADSSQIKGYVRSEGEDLDESSMPKITGSDSGPTITVTADATIDQLHIKAPTSKNGHAGVSIKDSSPTVKNSKIEAPENKGFTGDDSDGDGVRDNFYTRAVYIKATGVDTKPVLSGNVIIAGKTGQSVDVSSSSAGDNLPNWLMGVYAYGSSGFTGALEPVIKDNAITVGNAAWFSQGITVWRNTEYSGSSGSTVFTAAGTTAKGPSITGNTIYVDYSPDNMGIYLVRTAGKVEKNTIETIGSSNADNSRGILVEDTDDRSYIYTNLVRVSESSSPDYVIGIQSYGSPAYIYANTVVVGKGSASSYGLLLQDDAEVNVVSNIFRATSSFSSPSIGYGVYEDATAKSISKFLNNLVDTNFYVSVSGTSFGGSGFGAFPSGVDSSNLLTSPGLDSSYKPSSTSAAVDAGYAFKSSLTTAVKSFSSSASTNLTGPTTDLDGNSRGTKPDIGCYEASE